MPPPPSPFLIDPVLQSIQDRVESIESQMVQSNNQWQQANRNFKFYIIFYLVLLTLFLISGLFCLGVSLKLPYLAELTEKLEEFLGTAGKGTGVTATTIPIPIPDNSNAGSEEDSSFHILDFTPLRGAKVL